MTQRLKTKESRTKVLEMRSIFGTQGRTSRILIGALTTVMIVEMAQDYACGDESLGDFIDEDETGTYGKEASLGYSEIDIKRSCTHDFSQDLPLDGTTGDILVCGDEPVGTQLRPMRRP